MPYTLHAHLIIAKDDPDGHLQNVLSRIRMGSINYHKVIEVFPKSVTYQAKFPTFSVDIVVEGQAEAQEGIYLLDEKGEEVMTIYGYTLMSFQGVDFKRQEGINKITDLAIFKEYGEVEDGVATIPRTG